MCLIETPIQTYCFSLELFAILQAERNWIQRMDIPSADMALRGAVLIFLPTLQVYATSFQAHPLDFCPPQVYASSMQAHQLDLHVGALIRLLPTAGVCQQHVGVSHLYMFNNFILLWTKYFGLLCLSFQVPQHNLKGKPIPLSLPAMTPGIAQIWQRPKVDEDMDI